MPPTDDKDWEDGYGADLRGGNRDLVPAPGHKPHAPGSMEHVEACYEEDPEGDPITG